MKEKFIQFLRDNDALEKFEANISNKEVRWPDDDFTTIDECLIKITDPNYFISAAFLWPYIEMEFWADLQIKWEVSL